MISGQLRFEGFDTDSWTHFVSLLMPSLGQSPEPRGGTLLIVEDDAHFILSALHSINGPMPILAGTEVVANLDAYQDTYACRRVLVLRHNAMEELSERLGISTRTTDGYITQSLGLLRAVRTAMDAGHIRLWPDPFGGIPIPPAGAVSRAADIVLPRGKAALMVLYKDAEVPSEVWTAIVVRRNDKGEIDLVAGPDLLSSWAGPTGGDWQRDYRVLVDAVARNVAPVHMGLFTEVATLRSLLIGEAPERTRISSGTWAGNWAQQVAVRNVVIHPMPGPVAIALGADAARGISKASARVFGGFDLAGKLVPLAAQLRSRWLAVRTVTDELGFDPLRVLATILRHEDDG